MRRRDVCEVLRSETPPSESAGLAEPRRVMGVHGSAPLEPSNDRHGVRLAVDAHAVNGEAPQWDPLRHRLYWVDMRRPALHAYHPASGATQCWEMPAWIGCFGLLHAGRLVVALRTGLALFDPADGSLAPLVAAPYDSRRFCFN